MSRPGGAATLKKRHRLLIRALDRSGWRCVDCGRALMLDAVLGPDAQWWKARQHNQSDGLVVATIEHITPLAVGGRYWDPANVVAACRKCNNRRGGPETVEQVDGATTRVRWRNREFVRVGRAWEPSDVLIVDQHNAPAAPCSHSEDA